MLPEILEDIAIPCARCSGDALTLINIDGELVCRDCVNDNKKACCGE